MNTLLFLGWTVMVFVLGMFAAMPLSRHFADLSAKRFKMMEEIDAKIRKANDDMQDRHIKLEIIAERLRKMVDKLSTSDRQVLFGGTTNGKEAGGKDNERSG